VSYTVLKDPNGNVKNDRVSGLSYQSGDNGLDLLQNYGQLPQTTQVMVQNMMTKLDNLFNQLDSSGVLAPFQG
jgi:hypothetical protein